MKKMLVLACLLIVATTGTWAACGSLFAIRHGASSIGCMEATDTYPMDTTKAYWGWDATLASTAFTNYFWQYALGDTVNAGTCTTTQNQARIIGTAPTRYAAYNAGGNWGNGCAVGCPGTPPTGVRTVVVTTAYVGEGTANHYVQFAAMSTIYNTSLGRYEMGDISNGNGRTARWCQANVFPVPQMTNWQPGSSSTLKNITLSWKAPAGGGTVGNMGFYDSLPSGLPVIQDYEIYYKAVSGQVDPTSGAIAGWTLWGVVPSSATSTVLTDFPYGDGLGTTYYYFAMRPRFYYGSTWQIPFVGGNSSPIGPYASTNVFSSVASTKTAATFTTNSESGVASYQVFYAPTINGRYTVASTVVPAVGSAHTYNVPLKIVATTDVPGYIKVKANLTNGKVTWSNPTQIQ